MARNTWWVSFSWTYRYKDPDDGLWHDEKDFDARRFHCLKKEIKKEAEKLVIEGLDGTCYENLKITIDDQYITTEWES